MKLLDRISRLLGRRIQAESDPERHSRDSIQVTPVSNLRSEKLAVLSTSPRLQAPEQNAEATAEGGPFEVPSREARPDEREILGPLTPREARMLLEGGEASLEQFAASPRLHAADAKGDTPLHMAARTGNLVLCDLFVRSGSDPRALNNEQQTPADVARAEGHGFAAQLLNALAGEPLQPDQLLQSSLGNPKAGITVAKLEGATSAPSPISSGSARYDAARTAPDGSSRSSWSDERVQRLKTLWAEGRSASQIARELGGVSRNAVLSKLFRLGILNKPRPGVDSTEDQQMRVASDELLPTSEKHVEAGPRPFTPADEQRLQNINAETLGQWHAGTFWTGERIELLSQMWSNGRSANEIARAFGGVLTPGAVLFELHRLGIHDRPRGQTEPVKSALQDSSPKEEPSPSVELARDSLTPGYPMQIAELEDLLSFEAEQEPEEFFGKNANQAATGTFVAVRNPSSAVSGDEDADWELDLSPAPIAGEGIGSSAAVTADHGAENDFLQVRNRGRQSVKRAIVQTGTRISIDPDLCFNWADEILAKGHFSLDDIDRLVADCEGNGDLEELRINLQRNLEAAGFDLDQATEHDAALWDAASDTSPEDLADAIVAALTRRTRLPGTQRFVMDKSEELQLLEPMMRAKQELQLGILC